MLAGILTKEVVLLLRHCLIMRQHEENIERFQSATSTFEAVTAVKENENAKNHFYVTLKLGLILNCTITFNLLLKLRHFLLRCFRLCKKDAMEI